MAIQMRRGAKNKFLPSRLMPGEWAVVLSGDSTASDGRAVYVCFAAGSVKRMATFEDMVEQILSAEADIVAQLTAGTDAATKRADTATANANAATKKATDATDACTDATEECVAATQSCKTATTASTQQTAAAQEATGRANTAADEAEAFLDGFTVEWEDLSEECRQTIAQSTGAGASVITDEQGLAIIDAMADVIAAGREAGSITDEQGLGIIDSIFS